jgi:hypothetical protein
MRLVREQAQACQRIQCLVDIGFPELREAWDDPTCLSALAVLRKAPTARAVAWLRVDTLAKPRRPGDGSRAIGPAKAAQLKQLATESVAAPEMEAQVAFEMELPWSGASGAAARPSIPSTDRGGGLDKTLWDLVGHTAPALGVSFQMEFVGCGSRSH